jgi:hypothetical protein
MLKGKVSQLRIEARSLFRRIFHGFSIDSKFDVSKNIHFFASLLPQQPFSLILARIVGNCLQL